jgi:threonine dehydratase
MAVRVPNEEALEIVLRGVARIVVVDEEESASAMRRLFTDTHNVSEAAGAAAFATAIKERSKLQGRRVAVVQRGRPGYLQKGTGSGLIAPGLSKSPGLES